MMTAEGILYCKIDTEYNDEADSALIAAAPEMLALLRSVEWGSDYNFPQCPDCGRHRKSGHRLAPDDESGNPCQLAALLKRLGAP